MIQLIITNPVSGSANSLIILWHYVICKPDAKMTKMVAISQSKQDSTPLHPLSNKLLIRLLKIELQSFNYD